MKIGILCERFHPFIGGTETLAKELAEYLSTRGAEVVVVTSPNLDRKNLHYDYSFEDTGNFDIKNLNKLIVFADPMNPSFLKIDVSKIDKSIVVININEDNMKILDSNQGLKSLVVQKLKSFSNVVTFCRNSSVNKFLEDNQIKQNFISNFSRDVAIGESLDTITKERLGISKKIILYHAAVEPSKNQIALVKAFVESKAKKDYDLVLIGSARNIYSQKYYNELSHIVNRNEGVHLFKGTNNEKVINKMLKISDAFILPSLSEGLPITLLEAMSANLFWITTPAGGIPGTLSHLSSGTILKSFTITPEVIDSAFKNRITSSSREEWEREFTKEKCCEKYYNLIMEEV
jgi:glycosyltransferase involved in cell wall biosynthesis